MKVVVMELEIEKTSIRIENVHATFQLHKPQKILSL